MSSAVKNPASWSTLALLSKAEKRAISVRTAMDLPGFLELVFKLDQSKSSLRS